jgi:hypothetical protein
LAAFARGQGGHVLLELLSAQGYYPVTNPDRTELNMQAVNKGNPRRS